MVHRATADTDNTENEDGLRALLTRQVLPRVHWSSRARVLREQYKPRVTPWLAPRSWSR